MLMKKSSGRVLAQNQSRQEMQKIHWSYANDETGPQRWEESWAPAAKGLHQSPINIEPGKALYDRSICNGPLNLHYVPADCRSLTNNGHSIQITLEQRSSGNYLSSWMSGGPLKHKYKLEQFHFHWGSSATNGTEHALDGIRFASELHLVHWNVELFPTFSEAVKASCGLAVLTVLIKEGENNPFLQKLLDFVPNVCHAGDKVELTRGFDPSTLLPSDKRNYFTYSGSLTTPPCYESARFIIFQDFIEASKQQLQTLRELNCNKRGEIVHKMTCNCRPLQPINDRLVVKSFP